MISVIISSHNETNFNRISNNIDNSIGIEHEVIKINNPGKKGICQAYNEGASLARHQFLCFMHEDIVIHTSNWGHIIAQIFQDQSIGLVGVAGGKYRSAIPSSWWSWVPIEDQKIINIIQHFPNGKIESHHHNPEGKDLTDAIVVDGVWFCARRSIWEIHPFDERTFDGFHYYDIDFSLQIFFNYRVCVAYNILIEHFSLGSLNRDWIKDGIKFYKKWHSKLPISLLSLSKEVINDIESKSADELAYFVAYNDLISIDFLKFWFSDLFYRAKIRTSLMLVYRLFVKRQ